MPMPSVSRRAVPIRISRACLPKGSTDLDILRDILLGQRSTRSLANGPALPTAISPPLVLVGVLPLPQHHADRHAGQIEALAQLVGEIPAIAFGQIARLRGEEREGRRADIRLRHVP